LTRRYVVDVVVNGGIMSTEGAHLPYLLGSLTRETGPSMNLSPLSTSSSSFCDKGKALARQQRHVRRGYSLERRSVLGIRHQGGFANFRIAQDGSVDGGRDFLEKGNVRRFGFLEDTIEE